MSGPPGPQGGAGLDSAMASGSDAGSPGSRNELEDGGHPDDEDARLAAALRAGPDGPDAGVVPVEGGDAMVEAAADDTPLPAVGRRDGGGNADGEDPVFLEPRTPR